MGTEIIVHRANPRIFLEYPENSLFVGVRLTDEEGSARIEMYFDNNWDAWRAFRSSMEKDKDYRMLRVKLDSLKNPDEADAFAEALYSQRISPTVQEAVA